MLSLKPKSLLSNLTKAPKAPATVIAISSPHGSTGKTTLALNLAAELASNRSRVLLIDGDIDGGALANHFMLTDLPAGLIGALRISSQNRFDLSQLERLSLPLPKSSIRLMPTGNPSQGLGLDQASVASIVEVAKGEFDYTVIDCGSIRPKTLLVPGEAKGTGEVLTETFLSFSDKQIVVGLADPIGIFRLLSQESQILELYREPILVLNRVRNSVIASAKREIVITLQRLSTLPTAVFIPDDPAQIDQAIRTGVPAVSLSRSGLFRAALTGLVRSEILGSKGKLDSRMAKLG